ncbi:MAG: class I SAM-dependent methyltransferase, partial [Gaiellaceae bacterium]
LALALVRRERIRALDACGGSGNASLMLHVLGVTPTTVDVSREMLDQYECKASARGLEARTHLADIAEFLAVEDAEWDLIVFSSALHHLEDYESVLDRAVRRLAPGGVIVTLFDPTETSRVGRRLRRVDYAVHVVLREPRRAAVLIRRRLRRSPPDAASVAGARAERHALHGIDDIGVRRRLEADGLEIVDHERTYDGRYRAIRFLFRLLRAPSSYSLVARRASLERPGRTA